MNEKGNFKMVLGKEHYRTGEHSLTKDEYTNLLAVCGTLEDEVMIRLAVATGARRGDLANMRWVNVNLKEGMLTYHQEKKNGKALTIKIGPRISLLLEKYKNTCDKNQKAVFSCKSRQLYNRFQNLCEKSGVKHRPFHALRATCIKFHQQAGWTPVQTAKLVDDTLLTIQRHYEVPSIQEMCEITMSREVY